MTEEIMPREDRMGKILTFLGGCLAGVIGVFTVAAMTELSCPTRTVSVGEETFDGKAEASSDIEKQVRI